MAARTAPDAVAARPLGSHSGVRPRGKRPPPWAALIRAVTAHRPACGSSTGRKATRPCRNQEAKRPEIRPPADRAAEVRREQRSGRKSAPRSEVNEVSDPMAREAGRRPAAPRWRPGPCSGRAGRRCCHAPGRPSGGAVRAPLPCPARLPGRPTPAKSCPSVWTTAVPVKPSTVPHARLTAGSVPSAAELRSVAPGGDVASHRPPEPGRRPPAAAPQVPAADLPPSDTPTPHTCRVSRAAGSHHRASPRSYYIVNDQAGRVKPP